MARDAVADASAGPLPFLRDAVLRAYAQILFSQSLGVGLLILCATSLAPRLAAAGLAAVLLATALAWLLDFGEDAIRDGLFGYNALLVGLGVAALLPPSSVSLGLGLLAVAASVLATGALRSALWQTFALPPLTLPFLLIFYLVLGAAPLLGQPLLALPGAISPLDAMLDHPLADYLRSLGAIFFLPQVEAGALVMLALAVSSRIALLLSLLGYGIAAGVGLPLLIESSDLLAWVVGYNFILVAIALGGVWFVPGPASFGLATLGGLVSGLVGVGLLSLLGPRGIPLLILPFNLTVLLVLYAMRQRSEDRAPKSVDFLPGSPEQNLAYYRTRLARFGARHAVRLRAPFLGGWICTQGVDGEVSHRGPWRHAFDFEVADRSGRTHRAAGREPGDYLCYRAPVLAAADGQVVRVQDGVPDNPIGQLNLRQNWGNHVILQHAPALFSMVAHLAPGSIEVREGQMVREGDRLALCGNSGRAAVPHIHFQLQRTARPGDATVASELHEVIEQGETGDVLHGTCVPVLGTRLRRIEPDDRIAGLFELPYREPLAFLVEQAGRRWRETLLPDIDLYGNLVLRSLSRRALLYYDRADDVFTVFDTLGSRRSLLHAVHAALARVPFEPAGRLAWQDELPLRGLLPRALRPLVDLVSPFLPAAGVAVRYRSERSAEGLMIVGESVRRAHDGRPWLETQALLSDERGLERIEIGARGRRLVATREVPAPQRAPAHERVAGEAVPLPDPVAARRT